MRNRYQIFFFLHCICLFVQLILIDHFPLSVSTRSFEFDMFFASSSLKHCNTEMHLPKIAPVVFGPFFFFFGSAAASAMDRCTVVLMLWHFHKEMDVVGSIRQHSDIYIRKNGCCWAKEERRGGEGTAAQRLSPHPH